MVIRDISRKTQDFVMNVGLFPRYCEHSFVVVEDGSAATVKKCQHCEAVMMVLRARDIVATYLRKWTPVGKSG